VLREQVSGVSNFLLLNLLQNFGQFSRLSFLQCGINLLRCRLDLAQCERGPRRSWAPSTIHSVHDDCRAAHLRETDCADRGSASKWERSIEPSLEETAQA
jgi:hypothetical protein